MSTEKKSYGRYIPWLLAFSIGVLIEILFIPFPARSHIPPGKGIWFVFRTEEFYYGLSLPFFSAYFFRIMLPRQRWSKWQRVSALVAYGAYFSSAMQALANTVYLSIRLTGHQ